MNKSIHCGKGDFWFVPIKHWDGHHPGVIPSTFPENGMNYDLIYGTHTAHGKWIQELCKP